MDLVWRHWRHGLGLGLKCLTATLRQRHAHVELSRAEVPHHHGGVGPGKRRRTGRGDVVRHLTTSFYHDLDEGITHSVETFCVT